MIHLIQKLFQHEPSILCKRRTTPLVWLKSFEPSLQGLCQKELEEIFHFSLLWSYFESRALKSNGSAVTIIEALTEWEKNDLLDEKTMQGVSDHLAYFRNRYFPNGEQSDHFSSLNFRHNDQQELVISVLRDENRKPKDILTALLIIAFRFRNNLFHGLKWENGLHGQLCNFAHANNLLMLALELNAQSMAKSPLQHDFAN